MRLSYPFFGSCDCGHATGTFGSGLVLYSSLLFTAVQDSLQWLFWLPNLYWPLQCQRRTRMALPRWSQKWACLLEKNKAAKAGSWLFAKGRPLIPICWGSYSFLPQTRSFPRAVEDWGWLERMTASGKQRNWSFFSVSLIRIWERKHQLRLCNLISSILMTKALKMWTWSLIGRLWYFFGYCGQLFEVPSYLVPLSAGSQHKESFPKLILVFSPFCVRSGHGTALANGMWATGTRTALSRGIRPGVGGVSEWSVLSSGEWKEGDARSWATGESNCVVKWLRKNSWCLKATEFFDFLLLRQNLKKAWPQRYPYYMFLYFRIICLT